MNNNMLPVLETLLKKGYETHLFCFSNEPDHFQPKKDTNEKKLLRASSRFPKQFDPSYPDFLLPTHRSKQALLRKHFESYDFLIGSGQAPAIMDCIGRRLNLFVPYGSDLTELPVPPQIPVLLKTFRPVIAKSEKIFNRIFSFFEKYLNNYTLFNLARHQIAGIRQSKKIAFAGASKEFIPKHLQATFRKKSLPILIPMVGNYHFEQREKNQGSNSLIQKRFRRLRSKYEFLIFHHSRQFWRSKGDRWSNKKNDILFRGFQKFLKKNREHKERSGLICFEYGPDVIASKVLCENLGIAENVHWMKLMDRKDLMGQVAMADLGVVEFGSTWLTGGVLFEFLAHGIPVMQRYVENEITHAGVGAPPVIPANSPGQVCKALEAYFRQREKLARVGEKGKEWYEKEVKKKFSDALFKELSATLLS